MLGYEPTRQVGSHTRLTTIKNGTHHITIPEHKPIKIGTLSSILKDIAEHFNFSRVLKSVIVLKRRYTFNYWHIVVQYYL